MPDDIRPLRVICAAEPGASLVARHIENGRITLSVEDEDGITAEIFVTRIKAIRLARWLQEVAAALPDDPADDVEVI